MTELPGLALEGVCAGYGDTVIVEDVALDLPPGGTLAVLGRIFARWEKAINAAMAGYVGILKVVMRARVLTIATAIGLLALVVVTLGPRLRLEFFPEVDGGAFEM